MARVVAWCSCHESSSCLLYEALCIQALAASSHPTAPLPMQDFGLYDGGMVPKGSHWYVYIHVPVEAACRAKLCLCLGARGLCHAAVLAG